MARLLIIDDDILTLQLMEKIAVRSGHEPILRDSPEEAMRAVLEKQPDIVLIDMSLKDSDGLAFVRELREMDGMGKLPVVVVSAGSTLDDEKLAIEAGASGYILKPIGLDTLNRIVGEYVRK